MKALFRLIIVLAILAVVMKLTVPTPEKHREVAKERLSEIVMEKISTIDGAMEVIKENDIDVNMFIRLAVTQLKMKDYFVCNAGYVRYDGEDYMLTLGMFGHVFVMTDYIDEIQQANEKLEELRDKYNK